MEIATAELFNDREVDRLRIAFDMYANNEDRSLPCENLRGVLEALFIVPTSSELSSLVSGMDPDGRGSIDFPSFMGVIAAFLKPQYGQALLEKAFAKLSRGRAAIDSSALREVMVSLGQTAIRREDCDAMIREVDRTGEGFISLEDFCHLQTGTLHHYAK